MGCCKLKKIPVLIDGNESVGKFEQARLIRMLQDSVAIERYRVVVYYSFLLTFFLEMRYTNVDMSFSEKVG